MKTTFFQATELQMNGFSADPQLTAAIDTSEKYYIHAGQVSHVVRLLDASIALFSDFQLRVRASDIAEMVYTAGQGFYFHSHQEAA